VVAVLIAVIVVAFVLAVVVVVVVKKLWERRKYEIWYYALKNLERVRKVSNSELQY
jgi:predicted lysophospholipase L1 biosynthesis ABC-type transport system permease subunit